MSGRSRVDVEREVLKSVDDFHLIGLAIPISKDTGHAAEEFIGKLERDESERGGVVTDFLIHYNVFFKEHTGDCEK